MLYLTLANVQDKLPCSNIIFLQTCLSDSCKIVQILALKLSFRKNMLLQLQLLKLPLLCTIYRVNISYYYKFQQKRIICYTLAFELVNTMGEHRGKLNVVEQNYIYRKYIIENTQMNQKNVTRFFNIAAITNNRIQKKRKRNSRPIQSTNSQNALYLNIQAIPVNNHQYFPNK